MKYLILLSFFVSGFASADDLLTIKEKYSQKAYKLKVMEEKELMDLQGKRSLKGLIDLSGLNTSDSCIAWVYQGPASREEAAEACRGVRNMECVQFVYQGPSSRVESAKACRGVRDMECVRFVYQGPASRVEAAQSCGTGRPDRECR